MKTTATDHFCRVRQRQRAPQRLGERGAVHQAGERIVLGQRAQPRLEALALGQLLLQRVGTLRHGAPQRAVPQQQAAHQQAGADGGGAQHALHLGPLPPGDVGQRDPARDHLRALGLGDLRQALLQHAAQHRPVLAVAQRERGEVARLARHAQAAEAVALDDERGGRQVDGAGVDVAVTRSRRPCGGDVDLAPARRPGKVSCTNSSVAELRSTATRCPAILARSPRAVVVAPAQHHGGRADVGAGERR